MNENKARERRIEIKVVVDAYNSEERAVGGYCYVDERLKVPFKARCKSKRAFLDEWVKTVNEHGGFGKWQCGVSKNPADVAGILEQSLIANLA